MLFLVFVSFKPLIVLGIDLKYTPPCLENVSSIPGSSFTSCAQAPSAESITGYIANIYRFMIGISGILALGMIVAGAIYISVSPGSVDKQGEGRSMIVSAIFGIILIFGSYIILNTINPSLTRLQEPSISSVATSAATSTKPSSCDPNAVPPPGTETNEQAVKDLSEVGITISSSGNCSDRCNPKCTSLWGIPNRVIFDLRYIARYCTIDGTTDSCPIIVTGGTETGHKSHGPGLPVVDLSFNQPLADYIKRIFAPANIDQICTAPEDAAYRFRCSYNEEVRHLHVQFKPQ